MDKVRIGVIGVGGMGQGHCRYMHDLGVDFYANSGYKWLIDSVAVFFWLIIPLVFAAMPAYFLWFK